MKRLPKSERTTVSAVERDLHITERQSEFYRALCAAGGDVVMACRGLGLSFRIGSAWARKTAFWTWKEALLAEVAEGASGRMPRVYEQVFQNAYGSAVPVMEACAGEDPVGAMRALSEAQQGQIQDFTVDIRTVPVKGGDPVVVRTVKVKLANRDRSTEMALGILGGETAGKLKSGDRPQFTINVLVAGEQPKAVDVTPSAALVIE